MAGGNACPGQLLSSPPASSQCTAGQVQHPTEGCSPLWLCACLPAPPAPCVPSLPGLPVRLPTLLPRPAAGAWPPPSWSRCCTWSGPVRPTWPGSSETGPARLSSPRPSGGRLPHHAPNRCTLVTLNCESVMPTRGGGGREGREEGGRSRRGQTGFLWWWCCSSCYRHVEPAWWLASTFHRMLACRYAKSLDVSKFVKPAAAGEKDKGASRQSWAGAKQKRPTNAELIKQANQVML